MTPGAYLRLRREAAGLSIDELATRFASDAEVSARMKASRAADFRNQLQLLEADSSALASPYRDVLVARLRSFVPFDQLVYATLLARRIHPSTTVPEICRDCGCTMNDACVDARYGACAWAETGPDEEPLCTHCQLGLRREVSHAA